ncbi:MAG: MYG1 family protein [Myxococcales bacterium]|nr:MYG1 family protein [Myxococcales bacterium]MDD9970490.1 MYG1 family protein [Myxococcales bacterium]
MIELVVTHPGGAHKDDLLAVCVLIAEHGVPVARREPTTEELANPRVAVVDVGGEHAPERMNFDHHHFPREHAPTCALSLVLDHMGLYRDALQLCDWLEPAEWFDSRGPVKTAEWLQVPRRAVSQLNSPIDVTLLRRFAAKGELSAGDPLYEYMRFVGLDLLEYLRVARTHMDFVAAHAERWSIEHAGDVIEAVFLPRTEPPAEEPSSAVANYVRDRGLEEVVAALVYPDRRGEGYGLSRYQDHPQLDFARVAAEQDVRFAHKSGFMCKTSATDPARLRALIAAAWMAKN